VAGEAHGKIKNLDLQKFTKKRFERKVKNKFIDICDHGVRLIACQMSMEIMGIRQEKTH
jgi:peroxiredoxin family protein